MSRSLQRLKQIAKPDSFDDQKTPAEIENSETNSNDFEELLDTILSQIKRIIFGNLTGEWKTDPNVSGLSARAIYFQNDASADQDVEVSRDISGNLTFKDEIVTSVITLAELIASGFTDPMDSRGDIIYRDSSNLTNKLGLGSTGQVLTSDGSDIGWESPEVPSVQKVGTPANDQIGIWTGDGTIEGDEDLTFDGNDLSIGGSLIVGGTVDGIDIATDVGANNSHRTSDGKDHSDVGLNNSHRTSDGSDHSYIDQNVTATGSPSFSSITDGTATLTGGSLTSAKLGSLTNNGFVKTSGGDGTLSVDENTYAMGLDVTSIKTTNYDAAINEFIRCDASSAEFYVQLPAAPANGSKIIIQKLSLVVTNMVEIRTGGSDHFTTPTGPIFIHLATALETLHLQYDSATLVWVISRMGAPFSFATNFPGIDSKTPILAEDVSIDTDTRILTITPPMGHFHFIVEDVGGTADYMKRGAVTFPAFTNTNGFWYFYFDVTGAPTVTQTPWTISDFKHIAPIYRIIWNGSKSGDERIVIADFECHLNDVPADTHKWMHLYGSVYGSGLDISSNFLASPGVPNVNGSNTVVALSSGEIFDDNLKHSIENSTGAGFWRQDLGNIVPATLNFTNSGIFNIVYMASGTTVDLITGTRFPFPFSVSNIPEYITAIGARTEVTNNYYFSVFLYSIGDPTNGKFVSIITATKDFANLTGARAYNWGEIKTNYSFANDGEIRPLYRLIFQRRSSYNVAVKYAVLREIQDIRKAAVTSTTVVSGSIPASSVTVIPYGDIVSTNVQSALQELDDEKLAADGSVALTGNWDAGPYKITAETLQSDVITGTAPLIVASSTLVSNLNSDLLDGEDGSYYKNNGGAFITDVTPTSTGNVGTKITSSDGEVLDSCLSDTQLVTISVMAITGSTNYKPEVTLEWGLNSQSVTLTESSDKPVFIGSLAIDLDGETEVTAVHEDGANRLCTIAIDAPPVISSAIFANGYPGTQTELKSGDTYDFTVVADIPFVEVEFENYEAYSAQSFIVASDTTRTVTGVIANRGTSVQAQAARVRVRKSTGSWSDWHTTSDDGSADGINLVNLNNIFPTVSTGTITYPASQGALKNAETATVVNTVSNYDTVSYTSPNGDLTITAPTTVQTPKTVTRLAGSYNVSTNNFRISATRTANDATSTTQTIVRIAHVACTLAVSEPAARLRSGGNDGTSAQNHTITINSNQILYAAPTLAAGAEGTWQGGAFTGSGTAWTRALQIDDDMAKGTYAWGAISGTNLAGIVTSAITGDGNYVLGGFVSRNITLAAYANEANMNVQAITYASVTMTWQVKALPNKRAVGTTAVPDAGSWCLHTLSTNPTIIRILDTAATSASSVPTTITIQEAV